MTPSDVLAIGPKSWSGLIGKAGSVARILCSRAKSEDVRPVKLLLYGDPGCGKSAICKLLSSALADHSTQVRHVSAKQVTPDHVRTWMQDMAYRVDQWRVWWIEEVDSVSNDVEVLLLQFLDAMPDKHAALFTSNATMGQLSQRFQSRTHAIRIDRPSVDAVTAFLLAQWPELAECAAEIAEANGGDVRASLNDAQMELDARRFA